MRKGAVSPAVWLFAIIFIVMMAMIGMYAYTQLAAIPRVPRVPVEYEGEFDDAFLATKGWFYSDFTEQVDCNITDDILGGDWASCVYRTRLALNATAEPSVDSRDFVISLVFDIDSDVGPESTIDIDTGAGTASTGKPTDDLSLVEVKLYTHEDEPVLIKDFTELIEDQQDLDNAEIGRALAGDEYVLWIKYHTKTISPDFTTGDDIARITFELDTDGDVDEARITLESA